jgi:acetyl esterase/lipase
MLKKILTLLSLAVSIIPLSACSAVSLLNATIPGEGYTIRKDVAYADGGPAHRLDIYIPEGAKDAPVLIFYHGGAWQFGSKDDYLFFGEAFASKGFVTVIANYRKYPEVYFPAFIDDAATSFRWVHKHIAKYGGNPDSLFISGHSAGAHIAMMLALDTQYLKKAKADPAWIKGAIGIAGPYDFLPLTDPNYITLFSSAKKIEDTQPIYFARKDAPPIFMATGDKDDVVLPRNSIRLKRKLLHYKNDVKLKIYPDLDHTTIMLSLANRFRSRGPLRNDMVGFMRAHP